jgi:hypothetical protein
MRSHGLRNLLLFLFLLAPFCSSWAFTKVLSPKSPEESLRGLKAMRVLVENIKTDVVSAALSQNQLKTDTELQLRKAGIRVESTPGLPFLYIRVTAQKRNVLREELYAFSIMVEVHQMVTLARDLSILTWGVTWSSGSIGTVGISQLSSIRDLVAEHVEKFISDYLAVNSKKDR